MGAQKRKKKILLDGFFVTYKLQRALKLFVVKKYTLVLSTSPLYFLILT